MSDETGTSAKIGITACTGINNVNGTVARMAAYKVLDELRPNETVLICYPALAAKVDEDVEFVQKYPTIVIDGCEKNCGQNLFTKFNANTLQIFNVAEYRERFPELNPQDIMHLDADGEELVNKIAQDVIAKIDEVISNGQ
jgi:uncharacterized metal-binding protein